MSRDTDFLDKVKTEDIRVTGKHYQKAAESIIQSQKDMLDRLCGVKTAKIKPRKSTSTRNAFLRIVIADLHGSAMNIPAVEALLGDLQQLQVRELMILGDMVDCGGFLAEHHTWGYVAETNYSYADDILMFNDFLDKITPYFERVDYIMGNHERRIDRYCITAASKHRSDRKWVLEKMLDTFSVEKLCSLESRGIHYLKQGDTDTGQFVPAVRKKGKSLYMHTGFERGASGINAGAKHLQKFGTNVAAAHTHVGMQVPHVVGETGQVIVYRNPGCLCRRQPLWMHSEPSGWTHGYNIEIVQEGGDFLSVHIPIIEGKSLLGSFADLID